MRQASFIFNSKVKRFIGIFLVLVLLISGIWFLNRVFLRDSSRYKYKPFLEEATDYDVFFRHQPCDQRYLSDAALERLRHHII